MLWFENDYSEGAHPSVLQHLIETNDLPHLPYGSDEYTESAKDKIRAACACPDADIFFLGGGTQTNKVALSALLLPYEGAVCADTGHIATHEAGAIEATGHKVITLPHKDGKVDAEELEKALLIYEADPSAEHMVRPGVLYISQPTEYGTCYTKEEIEDLSLVCRAHDLRFYVDGARLAYALTADGADVTLEVLSQNVDCFSIGGTKVGALCGEALVFPKGAMPRFLSFIKQHGALFAKGWLCGVQFDALFTDDLYTKIGRDVNEKAQKLKKILIEHGFVPYVNSPTNQQFFIADNAILFPLSTKVHFSFWAPYDDTHSIVRFVTSWHTSDADLNALAALL